MNELAAAIAEWHEVREKIAPEDEQHLWTKFRLEWNYNSNHIEGNTLTYSETELLLIHGQTAGSRPFRDYEEMKAHNVAIDHVRRLATDEQPLTEGDVRDLNRILLKEPFWKWVETPDGDRTRKWIEPGKYKKQPNHVRTRTGELHRFAEPEETPSRMEEWLRRFRNGLAQTDDSLPAFLAESHWSFVNIHPFDDGNGRTARLITNYILLRKDLLPIVIKSEDRDRYLAALRQADAGNGQPLADFMRAQLLWSLDLGVRAARGEPIAGPEDLDKEMFLFVESRRPRETIKSDAETVDAIYDSDVRPTVKTLDQRMEKFVPLFRDCTGTSFIVAGSCTMKGRAVLQSPDWDRFRADPVFDTDGFALGQPDINLTRRYALEDYCGPSDEGFSLLLEVKWWLGKSGRRFTANINGKEIKGASQGLPLARLETESTNVKERVEKICRAVMDEIRTLSQQPDPA